MSDKKFDLKVTSKPVGDGKLQLSITVPANVTADIMTGGALALALQNKIDLSKVEVADLRKTVIDSVGEAQYQAWLNEYTMTSMTPFAIADQGLEIVMDPRTSSSGDLTEGRDFNFQAEVTLKPRFELSSYEPVTVKVRRASVSEEEVAQQLAAIVERFSVSAPDAASTVSPGDDILISIETTYAQDGKPVPAMTAPRRVYTLGEGFLPKEFDDSLLGMRCGEERSFGFELPGMELPNGSSAPGTKVDAKVCVLQINRKTAPELTDEWVAANIPEAKTIEGLRQRIREQGLEYKKLQIADEMYFLTATELAKRLVGHIPDDIYEFTQKEMLHNLQGQIEKSGLSLKEWVEKQGIPEQQFSMQMMLESRERLRQSFSLDAMARHLGLSATEEDVSEALRRMAPGNESAARKEFEGTGRTYLLAEAALRTKANKWLVDNAVCEYID
jgi:trigger factor